MLARFAARSIQRGQQCAPAEADPTQAGRTAAGRKEIDRAEAGPAETDQLETSWAASAAAFGLRALPIIAADIVVVDVETTGWLADAARITEIGAVRLADGRPVAEFSALVNPEMPVPAKITALTGISDEMVASAPAIEEVLPRFIDFAHDSVIVAHNAPFDLAFLTTACAACGITWPPCAVLDTAVLARLVLRPEEVTDHRLTTLAEHFGTAATPSHRALADAQATAGVLTCLLGLLASAKTGNRDLDPELGWTAAAARTRISAQIEIATAGQDRVPAVAE